MSYSIFGTTPTSNLMSVAEAASKVMGLEEAVTTKQEQFQFQLSLLKKLRLMKTLQY